ncbi:uncharacterized protein JCM10292_006835 [Rhodotorula paludigena]|uniref:uncharacterized protein n=1 Tax=Rhodotorula paludigena TaxID=86838 RepID=UPI003178D6D9
MLAFAAVASAAFASVALADSTITTAPAPTTIAKAVKRAETSPQPLTAYTYAYSDVPYQVNPFNVGRGPQSGYNQCNETTLGADSQCQTLIANNASDFCLWGSPTTGSLSTIGDIEAAVVAYCTNDKHGSRVLPAGAITGLQVMHTSAYIQWTGHINMTALGLAADDTGGELDPHGADQLGNPLGGLVYSTGLPSGDNSTEQQVISWNNFVGSGTFCLKLCDPSVTSPNYCENKYDIIGCDYNMPAAYEDNVFLECDGDLQDVVGTYTGSDGKTTTWSQPASLSADETLPWTPRIPASSNCVTYSSSDLFPETLLGYQATATSGSASATGSSGAQATGSGAASSRSGAHSTGASATTGASAAAQSGGSNGAAQLAVSGGVAVVVAVAFAALA